MSLRRVMGWLSLGLALAATPCFGAPAPIGQIQGQVLVGGGSGGSNHSVWLVTNGGGNTDNQPTTGFCNNNLGLTIVDAAVGGHANAVDAGMTVWVDDDIFVAPPTVDLVDLDGNLVDDTLTAGPVANVSGSGLTVTVQYYAASATASLRTLVRFQNPTGVAITVNVKWVTNLGSDAPFVIGTSSGDTVFTNADRWIITSNSLTVPVLAVQTHVLSGPGGLGPSTVSQNVFNCDTSQGVLAEFQNFSVPAGATRALLFFNQLNTTNADALANAAAFDTNNLGSDLLAGLTLADFAEIVNWDIPFQGSLALSLVDRSLRAGELLVVRATVENTGAAVAVDAYLGVVLTPAFSVPFGCAANVVPIAFVVPGGAVVRCASDSPATFPAFAKNVLFPTISPPITVEVLNAVIPAGVPPGTFTVFLAVTLVDAFADGVVDLSNDVLAVGTETFDVTP